MYQLSTKIYNCIYQHNNFKLQSKKERRQVTTANLRKQSQIYLIVVKVKITIYKANKQESTPW